MTEPITDAELAAWKAAGEAAEPAPWHVEHVGYGLAVYDDDENSVISGSFNCEIDWAKADADLVVLMRNEWTRLIAEVERLRATYEAKEQTP